MNTLYLGVTGLSGAGKDAVADTLADLARSRGMVVYRRNLSDVIQEEMTRRGIPGDRRSRAALIDLGNELRATYGSGELATRMVAITKKDLENTQAESRAILVIIAGIRNPGEIAVFSAEWGSQFCLMAVEAASEARHRRKTRRRQYREDTRLAGEIEQADQAIGIDRCIQAADWHVQNDGTVDQLLVTLKEMFDRNIAPRLG